MNFNDFGASIITLFHIMIVNNWYVTCDMICIVMGTDGVPSNWPRTFFVAFWVLTVLIMLNLVISFVLEIYSETGDTVEKVHNKQEWIRKLKSNFHEIVNVDEVHTEEGYDGDNGSILNTSNANGGNMSLLDLITPARPDAVPASRQSGSNAAQNRMSTAIVAKVDSHKSRKNVALMLKNLGIDSHGIQANNDEVRKSQEARKSKRIISA